MHRCRSKDTELHQDEHLIHQMTPDRQRYPDVVLIDGSKEKRSNAGYGNFTLILVPVILIVEDPTETLRVPLVVQKLLTIPEHLSSPPAVVGFVLLNL